MCTEFNCAPREQIEMVAPFFKDSESEEILTVTEFPYTPIIAPRHTGIVDIICFV